MKRNFIFSVLLIVLLAAASAQKRPNPYDLLPKVPPSRSPAPT